MAEENKDLTPGDGNDLQEQETPKPPKDDEGEKPETVTLTKAEFDAMQKAKEDAEKKFSESSREANIITEKNKSLNDKINSLTTQNNPTEEELREAYPDWDDYNEETKRAYREIVSMKKSQAGTNKLVLDMLEEKKWKEDYGRTLRQFPELKNRKEDFKKFAYKPTHKGVALDVLAKSFLFDFKEESKPVENKAPVLEPGSGGPQDKPKEDLTGEEIAYIRQNDPKRYKQLIKTGKI